MRIIAGELGGRQLAAVSGMQTRPTSDKVKGAIFNVLGDKVIDARVLDLFAGTGNLALEALSRGSREAVLVENRLEAYQVIKRNVELLGVNRQVKLVMMDAFLFLKRNTQEVYDLIFLDPPYRQELVSKAILALSEYSCLSPSGVIIAETAKEEKLNDIYPFEIRKTGKYGDTLVWYLQRMNV